jgi:hypothetical protein
MQGFGDVGVLEALGDGLDNFGVVVVLLVGHTAGGGKGWERVPVSSEVGHRWVSRRASGLSCVGSRKSRCLVVTGFDRPRNVDSHLMGGLGNIARSRSANQSSPPKAS